MHSLMPFVIAALFAGTATSSLAGTLLAYVANINSDTIGVLDLDAGQLIDSFDVGDRPVDVVVSADRAVLFVSRLDGWVERRSRADGSLLDAVNIGLQAQEITLSADGTRLFVTGSGAGPGEVTVLAAADLSPLATIALPGIGFGLALSPDGDRLYATAGDMLAVIDTSTDSVIDTVTIGPVTQGVAVAADGQRVYVATTDSMSTAALSVVNTGPLAVVDHIVFGVPLTIPFFIALTPSRAFVTVGHVISGPYQALGRIDLTIGQALPGIDLGTHMATAIELLPDGRLLIAASPNQLLIYDSVTLAALGAIDSGGMSPRGLAVVDLDSLFASGFEP